MRKHLVYTITVLALIALVVLCVSIRLASSEESVKVTCLTKEPNLEALWFHDGERIACQAEWEFLEASGAYRCGALRQIILHKTGEVEPTNEPKFPFKGDHTGDLADSLRVSPKAPEGLQVEYRRIAPWPVTLPIAPVEIKGGTNPRQSYEGVADYDSFNMRNNFGRLKSPELKYFLGRGAKIMIKGVERVYDKKSGLPSDLVSCAWVDQNEVWLGFFDAALVKIDIGKQAVSQTEFNGKPPVGISLIVGGNGVLWVGTFANGLFMIDKTALSVTHIKAIPSCRVNDIQIEDKKTWIATSEGLYHVEPLPPKSGAK